MNAITARAIEYVAAGHSPSDATVLAVQGRSISPEAIRRVEMIASSFLRRLEAEKAIRRST